MPRPFWLASYPKSGNTWFRLVVANLHGAQDTPADINNLPERGGIASARQPFDNILLVESGILTHDEVDRMRPMLYRHMAQEQEADFDGSLQISEEDDRIDTKVGLVKVHDSYTMTDRAEPLMGGAQAAGGAILIVRDPRDVAPSLANHSARGIDQAIADMADPGFAFCAGRSGQPNQLRQKLLSWSEWHASWLDQTDIPVHLMRYEDMQSDPVAAIGAALEFAGRPACRTALERAVELARFDRLQSMEAEAGFREAPTGRTFFRKGIAGGWRSELSEAQVAQIESDHADMMARLGYHGSVPAAARCPL